MKSLSFLIASHRLRNSLSQSDKCLLLRWFLISGLDFLNLFVRIMALVKVMTSSKSPAASGLAGPCDVLRQGPSRMISRWWDLHWTTSLARAWGFVICNCRSTCDGWDVKSRRDFCASRQMMNPDGFRMPSQSTNLGSHVNVNPATVTWNSLRIWTSKPKYNSVKGQLCQLNCSLERNSWFSTWFSLHRTYWKKVQVPAVGIAATHWLDAHTTRWIRMRQNFEVFGSKVNDESSSSSLFSGYLNS
jgi:hypothetical protein